MALTTKTTRAPTPAPEPAATVLLDAVSYTWPGTAHPVLRDLSLRLDPGEHVFIRGGSGTGKTTLISLIGGLLRPDAGRIALLGQDLGSLSAGARDRFRADHIGFVFQLFNLVPYLSLVDNVLLACRFSRRRRARALAAAGAGSGRAALAREAERLLERLQLPAAVRARRQVTALSVGQQQRVAVARALIGRPELIIADEPTSALDASARAGFIELLFEECSAAGASLLFVSHDEALAPLFPRTLVLHPVGDHLPC
jgi:putative ABC transport system ATP-binding protein